MVHTAGVDSKNVATAVDVATDDAEHIGHGLHIFQVRNIRDFRNAFGEKCCCHDGKHGVLCSRNFNFTIDRCFNLRNDKLIHIN